jgi:hypothetical protein
LKRSLRVSELNDRSATSVKFVEIVTAPWFLLSGVICQAIDSGYRVVTLQNDTFVALTNVVMERILKGEREELVSTLDLEDNGTDDGLELGPARGYNTGGVEKAGSDDLLGEVLLETTLLHVPTNNFNVSVCHVILDLDDV